MAPRTTPAPGRADAPIALSRCCCVTGTKADPEIRKELARLEEALTTGNRQMLRAWGGFEKAADRILYLQELPEGTPTTEHRRAAIDRYSTWSTLRLIRPEAAT